MTAPGDPPPPPPTPEPSPLDPGYERPESELPPLSFPHSEEYEFKKAAEGRRRVRIRNEVAFGAIFVLLGLGVLVAVHNPAFLALAVISVVALAAYEMTIATLE